MRYKVLAYFDGTRKILEEIDTKPLFEYSGDFAVFDIEYGVYKDEKGFNLIIVDLEGSFSAMDSTFENEEDLESRLSEIKETLEKIRELDKELLKSRTSNVKNLRNNTLR